MLPLKLRTRQGCALPLYIHNIVLEILARLIRKLKENMCIKIRKEEVKHLYKRDDMI